MSEWYCPNCMTQIGPDGICPICTMGEVIMP